MTPIIPKDLKTKYPDVSVTKLRDGCFRILCTSRPIYAFRTVKQVADDIIASNPNLDHSELTQRVDRHGRTEAVIVFKEKQPNGENNMR